ncbi:MAG: 3'-5' exonuclease [Actinobacteria bacterium]|nr:3'-5' exonuclease [Actinomycetota bacterium]
MSYVFLDLETTGLDADANFITEVGAVKTNEYGDTIATFHSMVRLPKGEKVPEFITELTGITDEQLVKEGRAVGDVMNDLYEFISGDIVIAQYAPFDLSFIEKHFEVKYFFDTRTMAYELGHEKASLKDLAARYDAPMPKHHTAISDANACKVIFFEMVEVLLAKGKHPGNLMNVIGTKPERIPKIYPKNMVAVVHHGKKKRGE